MPSEQFEKLLRSLEQSDSDPDASLAESIAAYRRYCKECATVDGMAPSVAMSTRVEPVTADTVPCEWVVANGSDPDFRLLFIHGGSFIAGSAAEYHHLAEALSLETGASVLCPDYRLAPEYPFPAGLDDCMTAWTWMQSHGPRGRTNSQTSLLSGASAGGGLAVALALRLRDESKPLPNAMAVFSPATDFTTSSNSMIDRAHLDPTIKKEDYAWVAALYVTDDTPLTHPYVSPVFGDFAGLPPLLVFVGEREVMHDEGKWIVDNVVQAGGEAQFKVQPGMIHNIQFWCHYVPEGLASVTEASAFLRSHK